MFFVSIQNLQFFLIFLIHISVSGIHAVQLILVNNCPYNIWPGILATSGHPTPLNGGLHLGPYSEQYFQLPYGWSGRIWARTGCCFDSHNHGQCQTGDCNNQLHCKGVPGTPPATLIEMTFGTPKSPLHFYDVSLVDGFNVPVSVGPVEGKPGCGVAGCKVDLNVCCPGRFEVRREGKVVACESACAALKTDKYCCKGGYGSPGTCGPTLFSKLAKAACPDAYSYAFDDESSLKSCVAKRYLITFCPAKE